MEIKLKNIHVDYRLSEETDAFTADLYINGIKAGMASNRGSGGMTDVQANGERGRKLIEEAEIWSKKLPPDIVKNEYAEGGTSSYDMSLDYLIDKIVGEHIEKREQARIEKLMSNSIISGIPGGPEYKRLKFSHPIADLLKVEAGVKVLENTILKKVLPKLGEGEKIQNRNIPQEIIDRIGIPKDKIVEPNPVVKKIENNKNQQKAPVKNKARRR